MRLILVSCLVFLLLCEAVVTMDSQNFNENELNFTVVLNLILNDPEFKALKRYEQYKILEAVYLIVANINAVPKHA